MTAPIQTLIPGCAALLGPLSLGVDVYDAGTHQLVDSTYALIDTAGRLYFYRAPLAGIGMPYSNADTLHFCHCDTNATKYFVLRTPDHLPLYTVPLTLPARGVGAADSLDLTDPSTLQGIPGFHYTLLADSTVTPPRMRAGAWAGNCADLLNAFVPGPHYDSGIINAADLEFLLPRNGITTGFSWADLDSDGDVDAADGVLLIQNQNASDRAQGREGYSYTLLRCQYGKPSPHRHSPQCE